MVIWQRHIPFRVSIFLWRLLHGFLAIDDALCSRVFYRVSWYVYGWATVRLLSTYLFIAHEFTRFGLIFFFFKFLGIRDVAFFTPRVMLLHWQQCAPFQSHLLAFLPSFILWQVWKVRNAFRFNS